MAIALLCTGILQYVCSKRLLPEIGIPWGHFLRVLAGSAIVLPLWWLRSGLDAPLPLAGALIGAAIGGIPGAFLGGALGYLAGIALQRFMIGSLRVAQSQLMESTFAVMGALCKADSVITRDEIKAVAKQAKWFPKWGLDLELDWLTNMRDWMISKKRFRVSPCPSTTAQRAATST